eukprot:COSAG06_NODE_43207_length_374_cov_0.752727_2_plen_35_part_01
MGGVDDVRLYTLLALTNRRERRTLATHTLCSLSVR